MEFKDVVRARITRDRREKKKKGYESEVADPRMWNPLVLLIENRNSLYDA